MAHKNIATKFTLKLIKMLPHFIFQKESFAKTKFETLQIVVSGQKHDSFMGIQLDSHKRIIK